MNKYSNKPFITDSKLFKDVSSSIGKVDALKELIKAYKGYTPSREFPCFNWNEELLDAFEWENTPQGDSYWEMVYVNIKENNK